MPKIRRRAVLDLARSGRERTDRRQPHNIRHHFVGAEHVLGARYWPLFLAREDGDESGRHGFASQARASSKGSKGRWATWNGESSSKVDAVKHPRTSTPGVLADQLFDRFGRTMSGSGTCSQGERQDGRRIGVKYDWAPDIAPRTHVGSRSDRSRPERSGAVICTWPKGSGRQRARAIPRRGMDGIEYSPGHMVWEGMSKRGWASASGHDRYTGHRNP